MDYTAQRLYTIALNADPLKKLTYAGNRVEIIIPNGTDATVHPEKPDPNAIDDQHTVGIHYSTVADVLVNNGFEFPPHAHTDLGVEDTSDHPAPIRRNAAYAWPYKRHYVDTRLSWEDSTHEPVYLELPTDDIRVSSYTFLNLVHENPSNHADDDDNEHYRTEYTIPYAKYEPSLTFTVEQLITAARTHNRPCTTDDLLVSDYA